MKIYSIQPNNYSNKYISFKRDVDQGSRNDIITPKNPSDIEFQMLTAKNAEALHINPIKTMTNKIVKLIQDFINPKMSNTIEDFDIEQYLEMAPYLI